MGRPGMPISAILGTKAIVWNTWGEAATVSTGPASAFCRKIPKGIQLLQRLQLEQLVHQQLNIHTI